MVTLARPSLAGQRRRSRRQRPYGADGAVHRTLIHAHRHPGFRRNRGRPGRLQLLTNLPPAREEDELETPLAYVSLVPLITLGLVLIRSKPTRPEPAIHDRQVDYIVGIPFIAVALAMNLLLPGRLSAMFWVWRLDLLSLPVFVAGVISIVFGVRVFWRQKLAIAYLLLAWPLPYTVLLLRLLNSFTNLTLVALEACTRILPLGTTASGGIFTVTHAGQSFPLSVVSACSGVNGMVGFLLVGSAFAAIVHGPIVRKILWLVGGMVLLWVINVGRLVFIFWSGRVWGEHIAIGVFHPVVGLITFSLGVLVMILVVKPLGMSIGEFGLKTHRAPAEPEDSPRTKRPDVLAVPSIFCAVAVVALAGGILAVANFNMRAYDLVANAAGEPKLPSLAVHSAAPAGWRPYFSDSFAWAKTYFGQDSTWNRYDYRIFSSSAVSAGGLPVTADVIDTTDLESFSAYGVLACYQFHGYNLKDITSVNLGGGIKGQTLSFQSSTAGDWSVLYWIVPVLSSGGTTSYERVVLYLLDDGNIVLKAPGLGSARGLATERNFLVVFARDLIQNQAHGGVPAGTTPVIRRA